MRKSKKKRIYNLNREICGNLEKINLFLELIAHYRVENLKEALVLADAALFLVKGHTGTMKKFA